ncbi:MAG: FAD-dependent oxidoreductase [Thermostichus sp. HHBFW_bins_43]
MAHVIVIGAGLGGLPTAYELRHRLPKGSHQVTLISNTPTFTFMPSLPWVALGLTPLADIQVSLPERVEKKGIRFIQGSVTDLQPQARTLRVKGESLTYDYLVVATGADLAMDAVPGLGPDQGFTQSVCTPHHAHRAYQAWSDFLRQPGPLVVGAVAGASCFGPAYEFALLADRQLRQKGLREQVPITFITPEPYAGHLGIGGMAHSAELVSQLMAQRQIRVLDNTAIVRIEKTQMVLEQGERIPFAYAMLLPPFRGATFLRETPGLTDSKGFLPVTPTYQHRDFDRIYSAGVVTQLAPPEATPLPVGVPKTGQMTEAMGIAAAHNIALNLGVLDGDPVAPTLEAICFADFGDTGILFLADPVLPVPELGRRRRAIALQGPWVSWMKTAFEQYFLAKMRWGWAVPWFERLSLRGVGLSLVEPVPKPKGSLASSN